MGACFSGISGEAAPQKKGADHAYYETLYGSSQPVKTEEPDHEPEPAPEATAPRPAPAPTSPITLDAIQGQWVNSMGAKISVEGTEVTLNGLLMKAHPVIVGADGFVVSVGRIWQLNGWLDNERLEFKEAPSREVMQYARSVVWTRATTERMTEWTAQMKGLGYTGSSATPLARGVEGCCPGSCDAAAKVVADSEDRDKAELAELNRLIAKYKEPQMSKIPPRLVVPDFSNRGHTGLSVEHVHYLATSFKEKGFLPRVNGQGHDIPVLVRESTTSELGEKTIENWRSKIACESGFPPSEHYERLFRGTEIFTSLGNGHFNQALNLFANECPSIYSEAKYVIGTDDALREAVEEGVDAVVIDSAIPLREREIISKLLNSKREFKWDVNADGTLNILGAKEDQTTCKQFEAISKVLDAVELNCLVRAELGVKDSHRIGQ